jgi:hypothetical protein
VGEHVREYLREAFKLSDAAQREARQHPERTEAQQKRADPRLAPNAHKLGYRGHCLTKSRRWSTTFTELRQARADHVREQLLTSHGVPDSQRELAQLEREQRVSQFEYVGTGHLIAGEAFLAAQSAAQAREHRQMAGIERYTTTQQGGRR